MILLMQSLVSGIFLGAIYGLVSVGVVLLVKSTGIFNFAHGSLAALGTFLFWTFLVQCGVPFVFSIILIVISCGIIAILIERFALRPLIGQPLLASIMATIGMGEIFSGIITLNWPGTGRNFANFLPVGNIRMGNFVLSKVNLISFAVCLISLIIFAFFFKKSRMGLAMRGTSENQKLAQSEGVKVTMVFSISWFIAIIMASTAGILLASLCSVDAEAIQFFGMKTIPVVILGGLESITGALLAGLVIGFAEMFTAYYLDPIVGSGFSGVTPFIVLMVILLIKPYGFFGYRRIERI